MHGKRVLMVVTLGVGGLVGDPSAGTGSAGRGGGG